jgi:cytoplasmic tRNA 2-thiolation protein 1
MVVAFLQMQSAIASPESTSDIGNGKSADVNSGASTKSRTSCRCGKKSVFYRAYNGEALCADCFNESIFDKIKKTISKYEMLHYKDKVAVALSGGKDSTSLLYILSKIMKGHGSELYALTIDEGIEGYREESVKNAESLVSELKIPLLVSSYQEFFGFSLDEALSERTKRGVKATSCAVCGPLRRRSIDLAAEKLGVNVVATAHNLDDILQTFYINLYSGDTERIRWLYPSYKPTRTEFKLRRIKPAMEIYEEELAFFAYLNKLPFQTQSCPYMNEGIRTEIRLHLNDLERKHPGIKYSTLKTVLQIARTIKPEEGQEKQVMRCEKCRAVSTQLICSVCQSLNQLSY